MKKICPECNYSNSKEENVCHGCGADISLEEPVSPETTAPKPLLQDTIGKKDRVNTRICFACNHVNPATQLICDNCGADISTVEPVAISDVKPDNSCSSEVEIPRTQCIENICQVCDYKNPLGEIQCLRCGARIECRNESNINKNTGIISDVPQIQDQEKTDINGLLQDERKREIGGKSLIISNKYGESIVFHSNDILGRHSVSSRDHNNLVSERHALVIFKNNTWFIRDIRSTNGTFVNGVKVVPEKDYPIHTGDKISLSRHVTLSIL